MNGYRRQRGMTIWGLMYVLITCAIFGYIGLKLFPIYLESVKISRAVDSVAKEPGSSTRSDKELAFAVVKRLDIDSVTRIKERNWKDTLTISKKRGVTTITAAYEAPVPLFYNLSLVASFHHVGSSN